MAAKKKAPAPVFAVVADCHVHNFARYGGAMVDGLNERGRETLRALGRAITIAKQAGCQSFYVAGDLTHVRRPEPAILAGLQRVLEGAGDDLLVFIGPGNHDCLDSHAEGGNTSCAPLRDHAEVVNVPTWWVPDALTAVLVVPFDGRKPMREVLAEVLPRMMEDPPGGAERHTLITHVGVYDAEGAPPWMRNAKDAIEAGQFYNLLKDSGFDSAFVGNYHNHQRWTFPGVKITQVGTLCPSSFSDPADAGHMALVRADGGVEMVQVQGPRFETLSTDELKKWRGAAGDSYYLRVRGPNPPDPKYRRDGVRVLEWLPDAKREDLPVGAVPGATLSPEEALHQAVEEAESEIRTDVADLIKRAWAAGAA